MEAIAGPNPGDAGRFGLSTASGAIVMALGIFVAAPLQALPGAAALTFPMVVVLVLAWLGVAFGLLVSVGRSGVSGHTRPIVGSFGIGTWVAGTVIVARAMLLVAPAARWLPGAFFIAGAGLWVWFVPLAARNMAHLASAPQLRPSGIILLATVATQSIALLALRLFPETQAVRLTAGFLMATGAAFYLVGLYLLVRRYVVLQDWTLAADWSNTNCILHGALSITGLAAVISGLFDVSSLLAYWACVVAAFGIVEAIEVARLVARVGALGWWRGLWVYDVSQWARNFTFGMFYAFTMAFAPHAELVHAHPVLTRVRALIIAYGSYPVLLLLLAELWLAARGIRSARTGRF